VPRGVQRDGPRSAPDLPGSKRLGTGRGRRDGTRCFTEKTRRIWPSPRPSPTRSGAGEGQRLGRDSKSRWKEIGRRVGTRPLGSKVQGREFRGSQSFGLWTAGLWAHRGTGRVVSPRKSRRIWRLRRPVSRSSGRAAGRDTKRDGTELHETGRAGHGTGGPIPLARDPSPARGEGGKSLGLGRDTRHDGTLDRIGVGGN